MWRSKKSASGRWDKKDIFEYDEELAKDVFAKIPMIARAVKESDPEIKGLNIVNNNGELAYQSVFHSHVHLIPRYTQKDGFSMSFKDNSDNYDNEDLKKIAENIKQHLGWSQWKKQPANWSVLAFWERSPLLGEKKF